MTTLPPPTSRSAWPLRALLAGFLLALIEVALVFASGSWGLFFGAGEQRLYVALALLTGVSAGTLACLLGLALARVGREPEQRARLLGVLAFLGVALLLYLLSEGRRVRTSPLRVPVVSLLAAAIGQAVTRVAPWLERRARAGGSAPLASGFLVVGVVAAYADGRFLLRLYPAFHAGLALLVVLSVSLAAWLLPLPLERVGRLHGSARALEGLGLVLVLGLALSPLALRRAGQAPNLAFVVGEYACVTGKALATLQRALPPSSGLRPPGDAEAGAEDEAGSEGVREGDALDAAGGLRLTSRNVLLITVDALRADRLGGRAGLTPNLDALAAESAVFSRAYTPTPHTSYALSSMLTGKYLRPVLELPDAPAEHVALPELLRRYGMRTAAFYPPAIFFVDAHRFESLRAGHFGFEYRKEMFASAHERVPQLREYLEGVDAESGSARDVFAWVHLFEPHEPYDPPARFARGESAEQRYDGEVAAVDDAIRELVRVFRAHRPGATVIVSADHGEEFGEHGGLYHGSTLYEEQVRIPLIWSTPGLVPARELGAPVELVDLATTLLAALAIPRDARMRGDDLGALLVHGEGGPRHAFAEIGDARMVTDGRYKAICESHSDRCQLYDLRADPGERRNLAGTDDATLTGLRAVLGRFVGSIPRVEALALAGAQGWPDALARAELGDVSAAPDLIPLLGDERPAVRAAAARLLGRTRHAAAAAMLVRLRDEDPDANVRDEAALASLTLGEPSSRDALRAFAGRDDVSRELLRRAALALGEQGDAALGVVLDAWAADPEAGEDARRRAVEVLGRLRHAPALPTLVRLLTDVRLSPAAAEALGAIGDRRAVVPLRRQLHGERYLAARAAQANALVQLGDRGVTVEILRFLGMEQPLPGGVELLVRSGVLARASGRGLRLVTSPRALEGAWACTEEACAAPTPGRLLLPPAGAPRGSVQLVCSLDVTRAGTIELDGTPRTLRVGDAQVAHRATGPIGALRVRTDEGVAVRACVVVPAREELPPPPPEPYEPAEGPVGDAAPAPSTPSR